MHEEISIVEGNGMKFTRILPKKIAIAWHEYKINRLRTEYEYYKARVFVLRQMLDEESKL